MAVAANQNRRMCASTKLWHHCPTMGLYLSAECCLCSIYEVHDFVCPHIQLRIEVWHYLTPPALKPARHWQQQQQV
jgi:hypothetical protein